MNPKIWQVPTELDSKMFGQIGDILSRAEYGAVPDKTPRAQAEVGSAHNLFQTLFNDSKAVVLPDAVAHFGPVGVDLLQKSALVENRNGQLFPLARIAQWNDMFVIGDLRDADLASEDAVFAVSGTTNILEKLCLERSVGRALDLGCGSGALSLRLASQAEQVIATDINLRALAISRANAALNRRDNVSVKRGSLYDPLGGDKVDLILGNLPFVMSPDQRFLYRDGDRPSGQLLTEALIGAGQHLSPGGVAQFTCNWPIQNADPLAWLRNLAGQTGIDMLVIEYRRRTPLDHTRNWNHPEKAQSPDEQQDIERRWGDWFAAQNIDQIAFGVVVLRKPETDRLGRFCHFTADRMTESGGGKQVNRMLQAMETPLTSGCILAQSPHSIYQKLVNDGQGYQMMSAECALKESAGLDLTVPPEALPVMFALDGSTPLSDIAGPEDLGFEVLQNGYQRGFFDLKGT